MQWLEVTIALSHEAWVSGSQHPQTGPEVFRIRAVDRLLQSIKFAQRGAVGGQSLKIVRDLGIGGGFIRASCSRLRWKMHYCEKRCEQNT
jgi:hypothetical protein